MRRSRQEHGTTCIPHGLQMEAGLRVSLPADLTGISNGFGMSWSSTGQLPRPHPSASPRRAEYAPHQPGRLMAGGLRISTISVVVLVPPRTTTSGAWRYPGVLTQNHLVCRVTGGAQSMNLRPRTNHPSGRRTAVPFISRSAKAVSMWDAAGMRRRDGSPGCLNIEAPEDRSHQSCDGT